MADEFHLDADAVKSTTRNVDGITGTLRDAFTHLTTTLDLNDGCWGTDQIGQGFSKGYDPKDVRDGADVELKNLDGWSDGVRSVVDDFTQLDGENAAQIKAVDHDFAQQLEAEEKKSS